MTLGSRRPQDSSASNPNRIPKEMVQKEGESVTSYIQRFHEEVLLLLGATDAAMVLALINGVRAPKWKWKILEPDISTYAKVMDVVQRFIRASDICTPLDLKKKKDEAVRSQERTLNQRNLDSYGGRGFAPRWDPLEKMAEDKRKPTPHIRLGKAENLDLIEAKRTYST